jgi:tetratricopeptide (TPR) repeat protein
VSVTTKTRLWIGIVCAVVFMLAALGGMMIGINQRGYTPVEYFSADIKGEPIRDTFSGNYLAGHFALSQKNVGKAAEFAVRGIAHLNGEDPDLIRSALRILVMDGRYTDAQFAARALYQKEEAGYIAKLVLLNQAVLDDEYEAAREMAAELGSYNLTGMINNWVDAWLSIGLIRKGEADEESFVLPEADQGFEVMLPLIYYQQALMLNQLGRVDEAAAAFVNAIRAAGLPSLRVVRQAVLFHNQHAGHPGVAVLREMLERVEGQAKDSVLPALSDEPHSGGESRVVTPQEGIAEIYFLLAGMHSGPQLLNEMMLYARLGLQLRPEFADLQLMLAAAYEELGDYEASIAHYESVKDDSYLDREAQMRVAVNYYSLDKTKQAILHLQQLIRDYPHDGDSVRMLAEVYRREKQYQNAEDVLTRWLEQEKDSKPDYDIYYKRAIARERLGKWDAAEADLQKALEIEPDQPDVLNYLGYSLLDRGERTDEAVGYIKKAYEQLPGEAHIIDSMGWAEYRQGNYAEALVYLEEALDLVPQDPTINEHLGDVYWRLNRRREARWQWKKTLEFKPEDPAPVEQKLQHGLPAS